MSDIQKLGLGQIITTQQQKDAVHMAITGAIAGDRLNPGANVGLLNGKASYAFLPHIGVIDPFLKRQIQKGEQCWLFLYPGTITGLRHEWAHPAFAQESHASKLESRVEGANNDSVRWMKVWAVKHMGTDYYDGDDPVDESVAYERAIRAGHTMNVGSNENARDHIDDTWWNHWETITGQKGQRGEYFSCAC